MLTLKQFVGLGYDEEEYDEYVDYENGQDDDYEPDEDDEEEIR